MNNILAFQILPSYIVETIVDRIAISSHLQYDGVSSHTSEGRKLQTRLPWMCHSFDAFLYTRFCMEYGLHIGDKRGFVVVIWYS
ncbi:hypothetical protein GGI09_001768 [Coemansia sp. S100]|nr:hypothetical protein GGI09_001768 [Coemansia sp. S100]